MKKTKIILGVSSILFAYGTAFSTVHAFGPTDYVASYSFEDGSGTSVADASGNGNTGTLGNGGTWTTGKVGGGIQLNGSTQDVVVADSPSLSITNSGLTLAAWIYPTQANAAGIIHKEQQYSLFRNANGTITYADSNLWYYTSFGSFGSTPLNTWSHVAVTFDGSVVRFYVNGTLVGSVNHTATLIDNANPLYIGSYNGTSGFRFGGKIDEAQIFNRALSAAEVSALQSTGPDTVPPSTPTNLATTTVTSSAVSLFWSASTDDVAVAGYKVFRNSTQVGTSTNPSFTDTGLASSTAYTYTVSAFDGAGNTSALSTGLVATTSAGSPPPSGSPVASWQFEEGSGTSVSDTSGSGNTGTLVGGGTWTTGQVGGAIQLNGSTQDISVPDSSTLSITNTGLTLAAWIYPTQSNGAGIIHKDLQYSLFRNANGTITYADSALWAYGSFGSFGSTPLNTWSHVAVTFDGTVVRFYVNGTLVGSVNHTATLTDNANVVHVGSYNGASGFRFGGKIDEAQIFNRALSAAEVFALQSTTPDTTPPSTPTNLASSTVTGTTATISWTASTDDVAVSGYRVYRSGALAASPSNNSFADTGLSTSTTYSYAVVAYDGAGNVSATSSVLSVTTTAGTPPPSGNPVASYSFEEGSGTSVADASGNGNTGTLGSGGTWTTGKVGGGIQLNGSTQDVSVPDSSTLSITNTGLTLAAWIYPTQSSAAGLIHKEQQYSLFRNANGTITYADSNLWNYTAIGSFGSTPLNTWSHVAVTFDGSVVRFYVNGTLVGSVNHSATLTDNANSLRIGSYNGTSYRFGGKIDEAQVFNRALSASEVSALQSGGPDTMPPSTPTNLATTTITSSAISLSWTASTDNVAVAGYKVFRNSIQVGTSTNPAFTDTGLASSTTYTYTVAAYDVANNVSTTSAQLMVMTNNAPDTEAPSVPVFLNPAVGATALTLSWNPSTDNVGVSGYKVYRDGAFVGLATSSTSYVDAPLATSTTYVYALTAYDVENNVSATTSAFAVTTNAPANKLPTNNNPTNQIRFDTPSEADAKRQELVNFIWSDGLPTTTPTVVDTGLSLNSAIGAHASLISGITKLDTNVSNFDFHATSYILTPVNTTHVNTLVIVHQGHDNDPLLRGLGDVINTSLRLGYSVAVMQMPLFGWNTDNTAVVPGQGTLTYASQGEMITKTGPAQGGMGFRMFLEPVVQTINYFEGQTNNLGDVAMTGVSGGGWTTHMAAAVDPRVKLSMPVAGSAPCYLRNQFGWFGGLEERDVPLFAENIGQGAVTSGGIATWLEIYALGGYGLDRKEIMVTNEHDDCCFWGATLADSFKGIVSDKVANDLGEGDWDYFLDTLATTHQISSNALENVFVPNLLALPAGPGNTAVSLISPENLSTIEPGTDLALSATTSGNIAKVEFFAGTTSLGEIDSSTGPYSVVWSDVPQGMYTLTVRATDSLGVIATSIPVTVAIVDPSTTPINVALPFYGATATSSSIFNSTYVPQKAINGDRKGLHLGEEESAWADGTLDSFPDWLEVDFNATKTLGEIDVFTLQDNSTAPVEPTPSMTFAQFGLTSFEVQYWNGSAWQDIPNGSVISNNLVWRSFTFDPLTTSKIRVLANGAAHRSYITELEAWTSPQ